MDLYDVRPPDVEALVTHFSLKEGEVRPAMRSGCRLLHVLMDGYFTLGHHEYLVADEVIPGHAAMAHIWFILPDFWPRTLWVGREISVCTDEGQMGSARITKIFTSILERKT